MSNPIGQIMFVLKANPDGVWLFEIARRCNISPMRAHYWIFGKVITTGKKGRHKVPYFRLEKQVYVVRVEGSNKLIALKKEGKA